MLTKRTTTTLPSGCWLPPINLESICFVLWSKHPANASFTADGATSLTGWLRRRGAMTALEAGRTTRRVNVLRRLPAFADLLVAGETTIGHLDALAEVATQRRQEAFDQYGDLLVEAAPGTPFRPHRG
jgi:hypothetical protein